MKNKLFFPILCLSLSIQLAAQPKVKPLHIGDTLPDIEVSIANYSKAQVHLSEFTHKSILLDFWGTYCGPCVSSLPKLETLQAQFPENFIILPVTDETRESIQAFNERLYKVKKIKVTSIVNDSILNRLFPHRTIPHYVWIDEHRIIKTITDADAVTDFNIKSLINGTALNLPVKNDFEKTDHSSPVQYNKQQLIRDLLNDSSVILCHLLTDYIPNESGGGDWKNTYMHMQNSGILALFKIAYGEGLEKFSGGWSKVKLLTKDSVRFTYSGPARSTAQYKAWWAQQPGHEYNYLLKVPIPQSSQMWEFMRRDLALSFPFINATIEKLKKECFVLQRMGKNELFQSKNEGKYDLQHSPFFLVLKNAPMGQFVELLKIAYQGSDLQVVDETGYKGNVDLDLETEVGDPEKLNRELNKYGLMLKKEWRDVDILVIRDLRNETTTK